MAWIPGKVEMKNCDPTEQSGYYKVACCSSQQSPQTWYKVICITFKYPVESNVLVYALSFLSTVVKYEQWKCTLVVLFLHVRW